LHVKQNPKSKLYNEARAKFAVQGMRIVGGKDEMVLLIPPEIFFFWVKAKITQRWQSFEEFKSFQMQMQEMLVLEMFLMFENR